MAESSPQRFRIGYALPLNMQLTFIQPSLAALAAARGIDLVPIDPARPIADQGPFHGVLHKLYTTDWYSNLRTYSLHHPNVPIVDPPAAIEPLHDRISMLKFVSDLNIPERKETIGTPNQVVFRDPFSVTDLTLSFPVIAKPLIANGSLGSHTMALVLRSGGLRQLQPPVVLQEFVNHGGIIFKVYVVGEYVECVKRKSLPDITEEKLNPTSSEGVMPFALVSYSAMAKEEEKKYEEARMPAMDFVVEIARGLRRATGLNLFNFDMIRDAKDAEHYLVIDINYFPGYEKLSSYETVITDFFLHVALKGQEDGRGCAVEEDGIENLDSSATAAKLGTV